MDHIKIALFLFCIAFALHSQKSFAGYQNLAVASGQSDFYFDSAKNQTFARFSANDPIYNSGTQTVNTTRAYNVVGIDGKTYQTSITRSAPADIPKVGAALANFAKRVGPLSMALATADLICTLSNICKETSTSSTFSFKGSESYPAANDPGWNCNGTHTFEYCLNNFKNCGYNAPGGTNGFICKNFVMRADQMNVDFYLYQSNGTTIIQQTFLGRNTTWTPNSVYRPLTEADWTAASTPLSTSSAAERLAIELEPMPIQAPSPYTSLSLPIGKITITTRDAVGNATGTQTTEKRLSLEDASTLEEPNRALIEEASTTTNYDINSNPLNSTETKTETASQTPPQSEPPVNEDIEIDFDESQDHQLETYEVPSLFSYTSWGSGSCPADTVEDTSFGEITLSYAPICDTAEGVRPFVILLALIGAFFIVSGSKT